MRVLVTGVTGFLARELGAALHREGMTVGGTARNIGGDPRERPPWLATLSAFDLAHGVLSPDLLAELERSDVVIHAAHDFRKGSGSQTIRATRALAESALTSGVKRQIFISSYSACHDAVTEYGQTKFLLEQFFSSIGAISVRPGLIVGSGGIYGRIANIVTRFPVIPLLDGGVGKVPVIGVYDLVTALIRILQVESPQPCYNLFHPSLFSLRELTREIVTVRGIRRVFLPIPSKLILGPLQLLRSLGVKLPIDVDNVRAFVHNQAAAKTSDLGTLIGRVSTLAEMTAAALHAK